MFLFNSMTPGNGEPWRGLWPQPNSACLNDEGRTSAPPLASLKVRLAHWSQRQAVPVPGISKPATLGSWQRLDRNMRLNTHQMPLLPLTQSVKRILEKGWI